MIYSRKEVVIIAYSLTSHILHRSIIMHRCRCRHIASASLAAITVVCTSTLPRVLPSADLPSHYHVRSLHPSFDLLPQHCRLTINGHPCHQPRPPHLHHFLVSSSSHRCPCVLTVVVIVALAHAHHTTILMCRCLTVSTACTSSPLPAPSVAAIFSCCSRIAVVRACMWVGMGELAMHAQLAFA